MLKSFEADPGTHMQLILYGLKPMIRVAHAEVVGDRSDDCDLRFSLRPTALSAGYEGMQLLRGQVSSC